MNPKNKFASLSVTIVSGGTLALANNIGFRGNCEIHENEPACNLVGADPLHSHQEAPYVYGSNTATATNSGRGDVTRNLTGQSAAFTAGVVTASGANPAAAITDLTGELVMTPTVDAPTYRPTLGIAVTPVQLASSGATGTTVSA